MRRAIMLQFFLLVMYCADNRQSSTFSRAADDYEFYWLIIVLERRSTQSDDQRGTQKTLKFR